MVICELLGVPYADREAIRGWAKQLMSIALTAEETAEAVRQVRAYLGGLIEAKRVQPAEDLTSALIEVADSGGGLTATELVANLQMLLVAGHDTTLNQLGNSVLALLRHPDQLALLKQRPESMGQAVEELLRYSRLSSSMLPRVAVEDVPIGGEVIKAGEGVLALTGGGNQDAAVFPQPDRLDITRPNANQHVSFGHGTHYCLGAPLARMELTTALTTLFTGLPDLALAVDESELTWRPGTPIRALEKLPVTW
jgi:cytochrome P450